MNEESIAYESEHSSDNELIYLVSEGISRDMRRYPNRFNTENE